MQQVSRLGWTRSVFSEVHGIARIEQSCQRVLLCGALERMSQPAGIHLLAECKRILVPGGVLRLSTLSLEAAVEAYAKGLVPQYGQNDPDPPISPCQSLNYAFTFGARDGFLWDMDEIGTALDFHGFEDWYPVDRNRSEYEDLVGLEPTGSMPYPIHVYEAVK